MSNYKCDKSDTFRIEVVDTAVSVTGLRSPVYEGESIAFTVTVTRPASRPLAPTTLM